MKVYVCGQKAFGAAVLTLVRDLGHEVVGASSPLLTDDGHRRDRLRGAAEHAGVPWLPPGFLNADTLPGGTDLIIAAHSHDYIGRKTRLKARLGAVGYHPSVLPRHRGRDAVRWTLHMRDPIAGGSVYWLGDRLDGGPIAAQDFVHVAPDETVESLWRGKLYPMGLRLIGAVLTDLAAGVIRREPQDEACATWEPSWERPSVYRPELEMIGHAPAGFTFAQRAARS